MGNRVPGRLRVSCVPMRQQRHDEKGYFFRAGQCAALSSFRVGKMLILLSEKRVFFFFTSLLKRCDKGCLVVTELRKNCSIFPMYTVSVLYIF